MIRRYLIRSRGGELHLVDSLTGYKGCKVLERNVAVPRSDHCRRVGGRWRIDKDAHRRARRHAELAAMSHGELIDLVEQLLEPIAARLSALEAATAIPILTEES